MSKHISNQQTKDGQSNLKRTSVNLVSEAVERRIESAWPELTMQQFNNVDLHTADESDWYGPWNTILHHLFLSRFSKNDREVTGFQISAQHNKLRSRKFELGDAIFYLVTWDTIPICVVEIKPYDQLMGSWGRIDAYEQLEDRLRYFNNSSRTAVDKVPVLYGIQCMGPRFMVMQLTLLEGKLSPSYDRRVIHPEYGKPAPPEEFWDLDVRTVEGACRLVEMVMRVYEMIAENPGVPLQEEYTAVDAMHQLIASIMIKR